MRRPGGRYGNENANAGGSRNGAMRHGDGGGDAAAMVAAGVGGRRLRGERRARRLRLAAQLRQSNGKRRQTRQSIIGANGSIIGVMALQ